MIRSTPSARFELVLGFFGLVADARGRHTLTKLGKVQMFCLLMSAIATIFAFSVRPPPKSSLLAIEGRAKIVEEWKETRREFRSDRLHYCLSFSIESFEGYFDYCETPRPYVNDPDSEYALSYWDFAILRKSLRTSEEVTVLVPNMTCVGGNSAPPCSYFEIATGSRPIISYEHFSAEFRVPLIGVGLLMGLWILLLFANVSISQQRRCAARRG